MRNPASVLIVLCAALYPGFAAMGQTPQDVPVGHWAYKAVEELAAKGLVKGYPPQGNFVGKRVVSRYEMAVIIQRVLARVEELAGQAGRRDVTPQPQPSTGVTPAQVAEIRRLVDEFRTELVVIRTDLQKVQQQLDRLSARVEKAGADAADAKKAAQSSAVDAAAAKKSAEETAKQLRSHKLGGYIQARLESFDSHGGGLFAAAGAGGSGQTPSNGGPVVGGPKYGFLVRRARLKMSGPVSERTAYEFQIDAPSTGAVAVKDAAIEVEQLPFRGASAKFGLFPPPFGYELTRSSSVRESPERSLGFSDTTASFAIFKTSVSATGGTVTPGSVLPLFLNQDRDVGAALSWRLARIGAAPVTASLGVFNGEGRTASGMRNQNNGIDAVGRLQTTLSGGKLGIGLSGYYGTLAVRSGSPAGTPPAPVSFTNARRALLGADVQWTAPWRSVLSAEYVGGLFETTPDRAQFMDNNHVSTWYAMIRHPLSSRLDFAAKYNEYLPVSQSGKFAGGLGRPALARRSFEGGFLYLLDSATRLRLWYNRGLTAYDPAAVSGPASERLGLITGEIQVRY